jgi:hypothetical protein
VERSGTLGKGHQRRVALKERKISSGRYADKLRVRKVGTPWGILRSFRADRLLFVYPGFRYAPPWAILCRAFRAYSAIRVPHSPGRFAANPRRRWNAKGRRHSSKSLYLPSRRYFVLLRFRSYADENH